MAGSRRKSAVAAVLVSLALLASGCASGSSVDDASGSRAVLYDSIEGLASDSTAIVIGTVTEQRTDGDATISTIEVSNAPWSPGLGSTAPEAELVVVGDLVDVRQDPASRPLLEVGTEYALWLTPTMLPDDAASQFFITGSNAGMYVVDGDIARRGATDTGDDLPDTIAIEGRPS
ncbi:hypothetical protein AB0N73_10630 [Microbacterium sp. NPDC089189]|uniref:hypothetical protein n=1 Tax=Microbacterium sp. NPDC089189 TaxID=3154972 RepID=UPI0034258536